MKKRKALAVAGIICCLSILTAGTLAYYTAEDRAHNVIKTGNIDVELVETTDQKDNDGTPLPFEDVEGVMPGAEISKIVQVKNTGANPAYVRVSVEKTIELAKEANGEVDPDLIGLDYDIENWTEQDDYFYYKKALEPGTTTEPLFTKVSFSGDMDNLYKDSKITVDVQVYAVQSENNGSDVLKAVGWPAE